MTPVFLHFHRQKSRDGDKNLTADLLVLKHFTLHFTFTFTTSEECGKTRNLPPLRSKVALPRVKKDQF